MDRTEVDSVSPAGVRDGDPAALAALCTACGPGVLAYAGAVCPPALALRAAAEAFARTRAVLVAVGDVDGLQLDRVLLGAVRRTTAELCPPVARGPFGARKACAQVPTLVAARLEGELSPADADRLAQHLARDGSCRSIEARFLAAERTWTSPPAGRLSPEAATAIVGALAAAGPMAGGEDVRPPEVEPTIVASFEPHEPHADEEDVAPQHLPVEPADDASAAGEPDAAPVHAAATAHDAEDPPPVEKAGPPAEAAPPAAQPPPIDDDAAPEPAVAPEHVDSVVEVAPRPPAFARTRRHRPVHEAHHGVLRTVVLPLSVVGVAAVVAMAIAGVFGEGQPQELPPGPPVTVRAETIPTPTPTTTTPSPDAVTEGPPPAIVRGNGEGEDVLGGLGVPGPGTAGAPAG